MAQIETEIIHAAAELIQAVLDDLPIADHAEWRQFDEHDTATLSALMQEITWADLALAVRSAAERMPEPEIEDGGDDS